MKVSEGGKGLRSFPRWNPLSDERLLKIYLYWFSILYSIQQLPYIIRATINFLAAFTASCLTGTQSTRSSERCYFFPLRFILSPSLQSNPLSFLFLSIHSFISQLNHFPSILSQRHPSYSTSNLLEAKLFSKRGLRSTAPSFQFITLSFHISNNGFEFGWFDR